MHSPNLQDAQLEAANGEGTDINMAEDLEKPSSASTRIDEPPLDHNVVDWDGSDDPEHPLNWSKGQKNLHLVIVSLFALTA
jgi:hypothetical protein